jgi:hypothetical protein
MADYVALIKEQLDKFNNTSDLTTKKLIFDTISYYRNTGGVTDEDITTQIVNAQKTIDDMENAKLAAETAAKTAEQNAEILAKAKLQTADQIAAAQRIKRPVLPQMPLPTPQPMPLPMPQPMPLPMPLPMPQPGSAQIGMQGATDPWGKRFLINLLDAIAKINPAFNLNIITSEMVLNIVRFIDNKVLEVPPNRIVLALQANRAAIQTLNTRNNLTDYDYIIEFLTLIKESSPEEWNIITILCYNSPLYLILQYFGFDIVRNNILGDFKVFFKVFPAKMYLPNIRQLLADPNLFANIETTVQNKKGELIKILDVVKQIIQDTLTKTGPQSGGRKPNKTRKPRKTMKRRGRGKKATRR